MENDNMFTVLPMSQSISLEPGEIYHGSITVVNPVDATEDFAYKVSVTPYGVSGDSYDADLITDSDRTAISKWIEIEETTGEVKPNESKNINFTITVPKNAPAGGQYATIAVSSNRDTASTEGVAVQNIFEMASIIYATVSGETIHDGSILDNNIPSFVTSVPIKLTSQFSNNGNVHEYATFTITVSDFFTGQVILPNDESDGRYTETIMPDTTRLVEREINNLPALGVVKINQTIYYNGQFSTVEKEVVICPVWFMFLIIITLGAIAAGIVLIVRKHRRRKSAKAL